MPGSEYYDDHYDSPELKMIDPEPKKLLEVEKRNKYLRAITGKVGDKSVTIGVDVYDVLLAFKTGCPALDHAIKKMLCSGLRGYKDAKQDKEEAIKSIQRSIELGGDR